MTSPDDRGITLGAGTDISVDPDELRKADTSTPDAEAGDEDSMGGTGGGNAGGAG